MTRPDICLQGITQKGAVNMVKKVIRQYSEAFRIQVVREYEAGESIFSLRRKYGIGGKHTVQDWVKKYGTEGLRRGLMVMQTAEERDQVKELQERNRQLEQLVAQLSLDKLMLESTVAVIERDYGIDVKKTD